MSPNLPKKLLFDFCLQIFSNKDHEDLFWSDLDKKVFMCFSAKVGRRFSHDYQRFCPNFEGFFPDFRQIKSFVGALAPPAPPPLSPFVALVK